MKCLTGYRLKAVSYRMFLTLLTLLQGERNESM